MAADGGPVAGGKGDVGLVWHGGVKGTVKIESWKIVLGRLAL